MCPKLDEAKRDTWVAYLTYRLEDYEISTPDSIRISKNLCGVCTRRRSGKSFRGCLWMNSRRRTAGLQTPASDGGAGVRRAPQSLRSCRRFVPRTPDFVGSYSHSLPCACAVFWSASMQLARTKMARALRPWGDGPARTGRRRIGRRHAHRPPCRRHRKGHGEGAHPRRIAPGPAATHGKPRRNSGKCPNLTPPAAARVGPACGAWGVYKNPHAARACDVANGDRPFPTPGLSACDRRSGKKPIRGGSATTHSPVRRAAFGASGASNRVDQSVVMRLGPPATGL